MTLHVKIFSFFYLNKCQVLKFPLLLWHEVIVKDPTLENNQVSKRKTWISKSVYNIYKRFKTLFKGTPHSIFFGKLNHNSKIWHIYHSLKLDFLTKIVKTL